MIKKVPLPLMVVDVVPMTVENAVGPTGTTRRGSAVAYEMLYPITTPFCRYATGGCHDNAMDFAGPAADTIEDEND